MPLPHYAALLVPIPLIPPIAGGLEAGDDSAYEALFDDKHAAARKDHAVYLRRRQLPQISRELRFLWNIFVWLFILLIELAKLALFVFGLFALAGILWGRGPAFQSYVTEPDFTAVRIDVLRNPRPSALAPGYIFISPYKEFTGWGPLILDNAGEVVWWGQDTVESRALDIQPCRYNSTSMDHLCYNDAYPLQQGGHASGSIRFFDNTYTQVGRNYVGANGLIGPDLHELNTPKSLAGKAFLQDVYPTRSMDLSKRGGPRDGYILDACFQEIEITSRKVVFQWCALDNIEIDYTYVYLPGSGNYSLDLAGSGHKDRPWDWFHINAIDRNEDGDYLVSARHLWTIFHIAGNNNAQGYPPGYIIWRLGGKHNDFKMEGNLNFSAQHAVRYYKEKTATGSTILLFNNAFEVRTITASATSGMVIDLNFEKMTASLSAQYVQPAGLLASDQGNLQLLSNGNAFLGWGHCNYFSEHSASGEVLLYVQFGGKGDCDKGLGKQFISTYRAWKYPWKGHPKQPPKIVAYAHTCSSPLYLYVSWNGATEVTRWSFFASNHSGSTRENGNFQQVTTTPKTGFETRTRLSHFVLYVYAEALDAEDKVIGTSAIVKTFVSAGRLGCSETSCANGTKYTELSSNSETCVSAN